MGPLVVNIIGAFVIGIIVEMLTVKEISFHDRKIWP